MALGNPSFADAKTITSRQRKREGILHAKRVTKTVI